MIVQKSGKWEDVAVVEGGRKMAADIGSEIAEGSGSGGVERGGGIALGDGNTVDSEEDDHGGR